MHFIIYNKKLSYRLETGRRLCISLYSSVAFYRRYYTETYVRHVRNLHPMNWMI